MKIKTDYILRLDGLVKLLWIILLLGACQSDDRYDIQQDGPVLVKLAVSTSDAGVPSVNNAGADAQITSVYILQFNADGDAYGTLRYVAEGHPGSGGTYTANLLQSMGTNDNYKLVILANLPDYGFLYGLYGKSYEDVQKACLSTSTTVPLVFDDTRLFPLFGVVNGGASVQVQENAVYSGDTRLIRAVARVDIGIGTPQKDPDGIITSWTKSSAAPFTMTEIQVWRAGRRYAYMPVAGNYHWSTTTVGGTSSKEIVIDRPSEVPGETTTKIYDAAYITNKTYCLGQIYLPEADLNWGHVYDDQHSNRLAIIVGGFYNNSTDMSYYRVDFTNDNAAAPNDKMDILRNHIYQFTVSKVADKGYASAELAYNSKPKDFDFTADVTEWQPGMTASVPSVIGFRISYGRLNGDSLVWDTAADHYLKIPQKRKSWKGYNQYWTFDYNEFYGESFNNYGLSYPMGYSNGRLYHTVDEAFDYEGAYLNLMVSGDDIVDVDGNSGIRWKTGTTLTAFDICRNYQGEGYNDWRLPRLSELALLYLNKESLEKTRGFTPFSNGTYWSASEYLVSNSLQDQKGSEQAWCIDFGKANPDNATPHTKSELLKIRCVRQM